MENLIEYAKSLGAHADILWWLENAAKKSIEKDKISPSEVEHIIDWMISEDAPKRLQKMSVGVAKEKSDDWQKRNKKKGANIVDSIDDIESFMSFDDESSIVKLKSNNAFKREGFLMGHCLGGYSLRAEYEIYSLRDSKNNPHATFEINKKGKEILQIKGKGNGEIHPKYIHRVLAFLEKIGIKVRSNEMKNLGYYHIPPVHMEIVRKNLGMKEKIVELNNEFYVI